MLPRLTCLLILLGVFRSSAQIITPSDERKIHSFVLHEQKPSSLQGAYHIVKTLTSFGEQTITQKQQACQLASEALQTPATSLISTYQAVDIGITLGCLSQEHAQAAGAAAAEALQPDAAPVATQAALGTLAALKKAGLQGNASPVSSSQLSQVVLGLRKLVIKDSGLVRHEKGGLPSLAATGHAYLSLAAARELGVDLDEEAATAVEDFLASPSQVLSKSGTSGRLFVSGDRDALAAAGTFISGAAAIGTSDIASAQMKRLLGFLAANKHIGDVEDAYHFTIGWRGFQELSAASTQKSVAVTLVTPAVLLSGKGVVEISVTDIQGKPAEVAGVRLVTAEKTGTPPLLEKPLQKASERPGVWALDFFSHRKDIGLYRLTAVAVGEDGRVLGDMQADLLVQDELRSGDVSITLLDSSDEELESITAKPGEGLQETLDLDVTEKLKASFLVKGVTSGEVVQPQHALIRLDDVSQGLQAYVAAKPEKKATDGYLHASISHSALEKQIGQQGGVFKMILMLGDQRGTSAREWPLGTLKVTGSQPGAKGQARVAPGELPAYFKPLPEIHHVFQQPSARPPLLISYLFTVVVLLPLGGLGYALATQLGANFKGFPQDHVARMFAFAFHAGIASILGLYTIFWLGLDLLQTLPPLLFLGLLTAASGYQALSRQANARLKSQ